jgi:fucose 4-O-acetylase-like acetyltransferase
LFSHASLPYVKGISWVTRDIIKSLPLGAAYNIIGIFIMPLLFFIAGYFALPSIKKGIGYFISNKVIRIAVPFFLGIIFLAPIISYIDIVRRGQIISYIDYWSNVYFKDFMQPWHFWFLSTLFFFFILFVIVYAIMGKKLNSIYERSKSQQIHVGNIIIFIILFLAIAIALFYFTGRKFPDYVFVEVFKFITFRVTRSALYILYFVMGIIVFIKRIDFSKRFLKYTPLFIVLTIASSVGYYFFKYRIFITGSEMLKARVQLYNSAVHVLYGFLIIITLMMIFRSYLNRPSKILSRLAANSYIVYIVHLVYTIIIQHFIFNIRLNLYLKFFITLIATIILSLLTSELIRKIISSVRNKIVKKRI